MARIKSMLEYDFKNYTSPDPWKDIQYKNTISSLLNYMKNNGLIGTYKLTHKDN